MSNLSSDTVKFVQGYSPQKQLKKNSIFFKIRRFFSNLSIAQKISYGYCLAIGVGAAGTATGLLIGDYYQDRALSELRVSEKQQSTIVELESTLTMLQAYPQQIIMGLGDPISLDYERVKFFNNLNQIQTQLQQLNTMTEGFSDHLTIQEQDLQTLEIAYDTTLKNYVDWIENWWFEMNITQLSYHEVSTTQKKIWTLLKSEKSKQINHEFEKISEHLTHLKAKAEFQNYQSNLKFKTANILRLKIIFFSIITSTALALLLAFLTSSAITNPIKELTQVAQNMTEDTNLSLRASVQSKDEVGRLAKSLNQLIQWVETYTYELENARQTLEERVDERTQALKQTLQELKTTQTQLIHTEKMSGLGQMMAGIAHEINNPIGFISTNLTYLNEYIGNLLEVIEAYQTEYSNPPEHLQEIIEESDLEFIQEDFTKILNSMQTGSHRIRDIVLSLRTFSHLDEAEIKPVDIHAGIDSTLMLLKHRLDPQPHSPEIQVICTYNSLPLVNCHASHLNQVFMHILSNAVDALRAKTWTQQQPTLEIKTQVLPEKSVQILMTDNGIGMDQATLDHIFDPFFTTKPVGSGTGLGLSTSYQIIVEQHQGSLSCTSSLGQGTTFRIEIPIENMKSA